MAKSLAERCALLELLVLDVDGVLTDGGIVYSAAGDELKTFHVRDGSGLHVWRLAGKHTALLTGRQSPLVDRRAAELGIPLVLQGVSDKAAAFGQLLRTGGWRPEQVCAVGDDLPDLGVLAVSGLAVAVADACPEVQAAAHYVTQARGGRGAVREVVELILHSQGRWQALVARYRQAESAGVEP